jgi:nucleoside-diphosphate-sugar epimerase|tara:strand:+ start:30 stop:800 length:771 start_codon:yes stop_codon:yes gene_type:complete
MRYGLVGHTGFVGSNLKVQIPFDEFYNSSNIKDIKGRKFDTIFCAGATAAKWTANQNPEDDLKNINMLIDNLREITADRFILISTVDVYSNVIGVNEDTPIDVSDHHSYGKHRFYLEEFVEDTFEKVNIIRLPGLFGKGLKKNAIYDLIHNNCLELIHCDSVFQFYDLNRLKGDIEIVLKNNLPVVNFSSEPVSIKEVALNVFSIHFDNRTEKQPVFYDMRTKYSTFFDSCVENYIISKKEVMGSLKKFVVKERND